MQSIQRVGDERPVTHQTQQRLRTLRRAQRPEARSDATGEHHRPQRTVGLEFLLRLRLFRRKKSERRIDIRRELDAGQSRTGLTG